MRRLLLLSLLLLPGLVHAPAFYWWAGKQDPNTVPYTEISTQGVAAMQVVNIGNSYGRIGRMANFNGTGSFAGSRFSFGISTSLTNAPEFTIAVWGRFNASNTNATVLTICDASNNESGNIQYRYNPTPRICLQTWNNACNGRVARCGKTDFFSTNPSTGIGNDQYFFLIGSFKDNEMLADLNGKSGLEEPPPSEINVDCANPADRIIIGHASVTGGYNGQPSPPMDLRAALVWDVFLSSAQRQAAYQSVVNGGAQKW